MQPQSVGESNHAVLQRPTPHFLSCWSALDGRTHQSHFLKDNTTLTARCRSTSSYQNQRSKWSVAFLRKNPSKSAAVSETNWPELEAFKIMSPQTHNSPELKHRRGEAVKRPSSPTHNNLKIQSRQDEAVKSPSPRTYNSLKVKPRQGEAVKRLSPSCCNSLRAKTREQVK